MLSLAAVHGLVKNSLAFLLNTITNNSSLQTNIIFPFLTCFNGQTYSTVIFNFPTWSVYSSEMFFNLWSKKSDFYETYMWYLNINKQKKIYILMLINEQTDPGNFSTIRLCFSNWSRSSQARIFCFISREIPQLSLPC